MSEIEKKDNIMTGGPTTGRTDEVVVNNPNKHIKIGRHGAEMIMTSDPERNERMLAQVGLPVGMEPKTTEERLKLVKKLIGQSMGLPNIDSEVPDKIGFNLTNQAERDVLFGVLKLMTDTNYRGNYQVPSSDILSREYKDNKRPVEADTKGYQVVASETRIGGAYENIPSTPVVRLTQTELIRELGYDPDSGSDRERVAQAVVNLATKQNFLMWTRFARDKNGNIVQDRNGRTKFELVSTFSPVLNVNFISEKREDGKLMLKSYEVSLAPVFLDEISREYGGVNGGYFLLVPQDCNKEVERVHKKLFPYRVRVSPTILSLCYWLRLQVQDIQNRDRNPFTKKKSSSVLRVKYTDLCRQLNVSETNLKQNKSRVRQVIEDGITIAKEIGYITSGENNSETEEYIFDLNLEYYPNQYQQNPDEKTPEEQVQEVPEQGDETTKDKLF